jgi:signal transduction histidine kinase
LDYESVEEGEMEQMSWRIRGMTSMLTIAIVTLYGGFLREIPLEWGALIAILIISLVMIWVRQFWWTRTKYALSVGLLIVLTLVLSLFNAWDPYSSALLIPPVLVLARDVQKYPRFTAMLAAVAMAVMFAISYASGLAFALLPWMILSTLSIRGINKYKEVYRLSQLHVQALAEAHQELQQTHAALQEASVQSVRYAALAERTRLARDMHDGIGHQFTSLIVQLQALEIMLPGDPQQAAHAVPTMLEVARKAMAEVRQAVRAWQEDESGLGLVALQGLVSQCAAHSNIALEFQQQGNLSEWPVELSVALYRVLQEALTNVMRHAEATTATIQVQERDQQVLLTVADNGCYRANTELSPGFGIKGMMERSQSLGGSCTLSQNQPHGLKLQVMLPVTLPPQDDGVLKRTSPGNASALPSIPFSERRERHG